MYYFTFRMKDPIKIIECTDSCSVKNTFLGDSILSLNFYKQFYTDDWIQPIDWYFQPGGQTRHGYGKLKKILDETKGRKKQRIIFAYGHNDHTSSYKDMVKVLNRCSTLATKHGARIAFIAPLMPYKLIKEAKDSRLVNVRMHREYQKVLHEIRELNIKNHVDHEFEQTYESHVKQVQDWWQKDRYHFAEGPVKEIVINIRERVYRNTIFSN